MTTPLYFAQVWDNTHMYDVKKKGLDYTRKASNTGSLLDYIENNPEITKFRYLVHLAGFDSFYNDPNAGFTIFIPKDKDLDYLGSDYFSRIDRGSAVKLLNYATCPQQFYLRDLNSSFSLIETKGNIRMRIERDNSGTEPRLVIDRSYQIMSGDVQLNNGVIHFVSGLLCPELFV